MPDSDQEQPRLSCAAEEAVRREFPELYAFFDAHPVRRPSGEEIWERVLRVARHSRPILEAVRARGLEMVDVQNAIPRGKDPRPLYEAVIEWLPRLEEPLTLHICISRLLGPEARGLVKKNREMLLDLARKWNAAGGTGDAEHMLAALAQCLMIAARERDLPEILTWARDSRLPHGARANYVGDLQRFARKPGPARKALCEFVQDEGVGSSAVWALGGAMRAEALPLLRELRESNPHDRVREAARAVVKKLEARSRKLALPVARVDRLPENHVMTSVELDTDRVPELLAILEGELGGQFAPGVAGQLALSAEQLKRGRSRFHIVDVASGDGGVTKMGVGFYAEDEDVVVAELHFDARWEGAVDAALKRSVR